MTTPAVVLSPCRKGEKILGKKRNKMEIAFGKVTDSITQLIDELQSEGGIDSLKLKQLKELISAAKELTAIIHAGKDDISENTQISVVFEKDGDKWAK